MSRERMTGRILIVWEDTVGTVLTSDAAAGATVLNVEDVAPFNGATNDDGPGGWLQVGDQVVQYKAIDDDASTITLSAGLPAAVTVGSETGDVLVWNDLYGEADTVQWAEVKPSGKRHQADTIEAVVSDSVDGLANGDRGGPGETCTLVRDGDGWELVRVNGRPAKSRGVQFAQDRFTVKADGVQTLPLSHVPIDNSEHVYWEGRYQPSSEWSRQGQTITVADAAGDLRVGDQIVIEYAYRVGVANRLNVPLGYNWLYKTGLGPSASNAGDFDDSNWSVGVSPFGWREANYARFATEFGTTVPAPMNVWTRIHVRTAGGALTFRVDIDDDAAVYIDGLKVADVHVTDPSSSDFAVAVGAGDHVIAVYGSDAGNQSSATTEGGYLGVTITEGS